MTGPGRPAVPARPSPAPLVHVVRGDPTPAQLAALVTVLVARTAPPPPEPVRLSAWRDRRAALRTPLERGSGAWRASGLPR